MSHNADTAPTDAPPSYAMATGPSQTSTKSSHLEVPGRNGIPALSRRSMEDEHRTLPDGWVRQFDTKEKHQFFVDIKADPPRSIWHHPYDDEQYLSTLSSEERELLQESEKTSKEKASVHFDHTDDETSPPTTSHTTAATSAGLPARPSGAEQKKSFARSLKDKLTGSTHEERQQHRAQQAEEERKYYEAHLKFRNAMRQAQMTGQPVFLGKDQSGHDVFVEPPQYYQGGYANGGYGYNPWSSGVYQNPNNRFIAPPGMTYGRPLGPSRYGGGMGMPIAGGLLGGMLLGGLLF